MPPVGLTYVGSAESEWRTGIPALRQYIRHLGARAEDRAVLTLLGPFRAQVKSTYTLLTAIDREAMGDSVARQKVALSKRWTSSESATGLQDVGVYHLQCVVTSKPRV